MVVDVVHGGGSADFSDVQQAQAEVLAELTSGVPDDSMPENPLVQQPDKSASLSSVHADDNINFSAVSV